jgi:hypothetical protein
MFENTFFIVDKLGGTKNLNFPSAVVLSLFIIFKKASTKDMLDRFPEITSRLKFQNLKGVFFLFTKIIVLGCNC